MTLKVTLLARKATGNHFMKPTSLGKLKSAVTGFCHARSREAVFDVHNTQSLNMCKPQQELALGRSVTSSQSQWHIDAARRFNRSLLACFFYCYLPVRVIKDSVMLGKQHGTTHCSYCRSIDARNAIQETVYWPNPLENTVSLPRIRQLEF